MSELTEAIPVERIQLGVRMEKRMTQVLKGLAEFKNMTLGALLEEIVLHSFEPILGQEGQMCASPHSQKSLQAIADFKRIYGMDYGSHANYQFHEKNLKAESES
jgi:predicted DNA-binding ribbon-helix-helix protein